MKELLEKESSEKLFSIFKYDGSDNFEKKLISGKILQERKFDIEKLKEEKSKTRESVAYQIRHFKDNEELFRKHKARLRNEIIGVISIMFFLLIYFFKFSNFDSDRLTDKYLFGFIIIFHSIILIYRVLSFKKIVRQNVNVEIKDRELLEKQLELIDSEWQF